MQKNSPFYWLFHYNINKMKEGGTFQQIVNTFSGESQVCEDQSGEPLDMNQCLSAFIFLVAGGGLGLLFLLYVKNLIIISLCKCIKFTRIEFYNVIHQVWYLRFFLEGWKDFCQISG